MQNYKERFPELKYLLGAYFHQDWLHDYEWDGEEPTFGAVVRNFKATNPLNTVVRATQELEQFLALHLDEEEMRETLRKLGSAYYAPGGGQTFRQWLEEVAVILKEPQDSARQVRVIS